MRGQRRLIWQLFPGYLLVILLALGIITAFTTQSIRRLFQTEVGADLRVRATLVADEFARGNTSLSADFADEYCKRVGQAIHTRITIMRPDGVVIGDTDEDPALMDNHAGRPEMAAALEGRAGEATRFSKTVKLDMMYVAVPIWRSGELAGVARVAAPLRAIAESLNAVYYRLFIAGILTALLAAGLSWVTTRRIVKPLDELRRGAARFAAGELDVALPTPKSQELTSLTDAMNAMARQLGARIETVLRQRNEQEAVLASMIEGVVAVDKDERVITLNQAAAGFLGVHTHEIQGMALRDVVKHSGLLAFFERTLAGEDNLEAEIVFSSPSETILQAHGAVLRHASGQEAGAVVVLHDITRLRKLEQVRRDFVANVSHELRTPITSIKGFIETLEDGAIDEPADARRFLAILRKQAERLSAIVEDLLTLSRLEQEESTEEITLTRRPVRECLAGAAQLCAAAAEAKSITLEIECDPDLETRVNGPLLEQAVVNLVDNAIKYSEPADTVRIAAAQQNGEVVIRVEDQGQGIPPEHLPRIFERFYRADKARSRQLGGTGLGLAIVNHIARVHGGRVSVDSKPGSGSEFRIHLPME